MKFENHTRSGFAVLGGTFDPIHNGHLALAQAAFNAFPVTHVRFMPAGLPWQKANQSISSAQDRKAMIERAIKLYPFIQLDTLELKKLHPTYTIDTVKYMREQAGPSLPIIWVLGTDQWQNLHTWKDWQSLTDYVHLAVGTRITDAQADKQVLDFFKDKETTPEQLMQTSFGRLCFFSMPAHPANATQIREAFKTGQLKGVANWLPTDVIQYIEQHHVYDTQK